MINIKCEKCDSTGKVLDYLSALITGGMTYFIGRHMCKYCHGSGYIHVHEDDFAYFIKTN